ncbi:MAG: thiamine pyrophosphate-binding protein [Desulfovermiculus sp.]|nr:thiamine pyrophosphate-binding protein [Desulfovermiculus sp.]
MAASQFAENEIPVPEAIIRVIEDYGIEYVFGVPGGNTMPLFGALNRHRNTIRTVAVRHESLAGVMAEVYGRLTGLPGVVMGQGLFMLSNAMLGVMEAYLGSTPMLLMTDMSDGAPFSHHAPYQAGTGDYGTWNAHQCFSTVTKETYVAYAPAQAVQNTQTAVRAAIQGQEGPVALVYHSSSLNGQVGPKSIPKIYTTKSYGRAKGPSASLDEVEKAVQSLRKARHPVIIAGNGVRLARAEPMLKQFAYLNGSAVATSAAGKGVFPEDHPQALGVFGTFGLEAANQFISASDVILILGSKLSPSDTAFESTKLIDPMRQRLIQVDIESRNANWVFPCEQVLTGDLAVIMTQMCQSIEASGCVSTETFQHRQWTIREVREKFGYFNESEYASDNHPILPQRVIAEIRKLVADDAFVTCDAGENRLFMTRFFQTKDGGEFLSPAATGGMGYAIPAAMSAKLLFPDRQTIAVCGDGGFVMSMNGMITAVEEKIPIVTVVLNNNAYGWVTHYLQEESIAAEFPDMNLAEIARAMGCRGMRVETPAQLNDALTIALESSVPAVLDVICSKEISYRDIISSFAKE